MNIMKTKVDNHRTLVQFHNKKKKKQTFLQIFPLLHVRFTNNNIGNCSTSSNWRARVYVIIIHIQLKS